MIVRPHGEELLLVDQEEHARLAGELAARLDDPPEPIGAFVAAARLHDNGWREEDAMPRLDAATGLPRDYRGLPAAPYRALWTRGIERAVAADARVGLLVSLHGLRFVRPGRDPAARAFHDAHRAKQDALLRKLGETGAWDALPPALARASGWIAALDAASLFACGEWGDSLDLPTDGGRLRCLREGDVVRIDPFPLRAPCTLAVRGRVLPRARYADEDLLRQEHAQARVVTLTRRFAPVQDPGGA